MRRFFNNNTGEKMKLYKDYELNREAFQIDFKDCSDFLMRDILIDGCRAFVCVMDGLVDTLQLNETVMEPLLRSKLDFETPQEHLALLKQCTVGAPEMNDAETFEDCYFFLMSGFAVLLLEGVRSAVVFGVQGWNRRNTDEPTNEAMAKGAKECFVETLNDNKALLRKRLKTPQLKLKQLKLGTAAATPVVLAYMEDRADEAMLQKLEDTLQHTPLDTVPAYGCLGELLDTDITSFFSGVGNTERPDVLASKLLEGRVGIMTEGTPFVLYAPYLFTDNFSSLDDYDNPPFYATFTRGLKYLSFILSVFLPALYVAIGSFHEEMIPTRLLYIIVTSEEATPFPLMLEAIIIHILYEIMREAGLRLPKTIGHAVSIIGAIVIGEAMVSAGIIGEPMLVVVALTAIASYVVYPLYESVAVMRIVFILLGGFAGIYGISLGMAILFVNLCAVNPFGVPYSAPLSPLTKRSVGDTLLRQSWKKLLKRRVNIYHLKGAEGERSRD